MNEYFDEVIFQGSNIPKEVEQIMNSVSEKTNKSFDNDEQRLAYHLGVKNTISALKSLLDEDMRSDNIIFYYPKTKTSEEMSAGEVIEWLKSLE